jgi:hypothetical protein
MSLSREVDSNRRRKMRQRNSVPAEGEWLELALEIQLEAAAGVRGGG